jgi:hypothetical protein
MVKIALEALALRFLDQAEPADYLCDETQLISCAIKLPGKVPRVTQCIIGGYMIRTLGSAPKSDPTPTHAKFSAITGGARSKPQS